MDERAAEKKRIRREALARRDGLTEEQRRDYSVRIVEGLTRLPCYRDADAVLTYASFRSEVDTFPLIERAFADGKAVFAPKVAGKEMVFYRIFSVRDLAAGYRGIQEPVGGVALEEWLNDQTSQLKNDRQREPLTESGTRSCAPALPAVLICMPGAAFDRARHRIGYGGGFYDRYVSGLLRDAETSHRQMRLATAALAFDCQIFDVVPWEAHDICPMQIVTETEMISIL